MTVLHFDADKMIQKALAERDPAKTLKKLEPYLELCQELIRISKSAEKDPKSKAITDFKIDYTNNSEKQLRELITLLGLPDWKPQRG